MKNKTTTTIKNDKLFEVILEESEIITKERFFKMLASKEKDLTLTIDRLGNTYTSNGKMIKEKHLQDSS